MTCVSVYNEKSDMAAILIKQRDGIPCEVPSKIFSSDVDAFSHKHASVYGENHTGTVPSLPRLGCALIARKGKRSPFLFNTSQPCTTHSIALSGEKVASFH